MKTYWVKGFKPVLAKRSLFPSAAHVFYIVQKSQNCNHQLQCGHRDNSERENVSEELFGYLS